MIGSSALGHRLVGAQSWFVASELLRRHPSMTLIETHPGGGQNDCLSVVAKGASGPETIKQRN